jgi:hypothetical protein
MVANGCSSDGVREFRFHGSTAVERARYHPESRTLDIWYVGGDRYSYFDVPPKTFEQLCSAPSAGEFVNRRIKPAHRYELERRRRRFRPS